MSTRDEKTPTEKKPRIDGAKLRGRIQRTIILLAVLAFLVGSVGLYLFEAFGSNSVDGTQPQAQQKNLPIDPNAYKTTVPVTELQKTDIKVGNGAEVQPGDSISAAYEGTLATTGGIFDKTDANKPAQFSLSQVIPGWQQGIPGMKVGGTRQLVIPASLAYGAQGTPDGSIPPNSDLVFTVTVTAINK